MPLPPVCGCDGKTYDACSVEVAGVNVAHQGACSDNPACEGVSCAVAEGCCECRAYNPATDPPPEDCPVMCDASACVGLTPQAYCFGAGLCILGDGGACLQDSDCTLINDCCHCMAVPAGKAKPLEAQCAGTKCKQPMCGAMGIGSVKARCVTGVCRLAS